jgi:type IV conjugative transfer system pilin TraA
MHKRKWFTPRNILLVGSLAVVAAHPAFAADDLFAGAKDAIKVTVGEDSGIEMAIMTVGAIAAALTGFVTKNWIGAIAGFTIGVIFWNIVSPMVGLA